MNHFGKYSSDRNIPGIKNTKSIHWNLTPSQLIEDTIKNNQGVLTDSGSLLIETGEFTGRSPKDRFIVCDNITENTVWWGDVNIKFTEDNFNNLLQKINTYLIDKNIYVRDAFACADKSHQLKLRVTTEFPWSNLFAKNMFIRPNNEELSNFTPEWNIICVPGFLADPNLDGTRQHNFAILNFTQKIILIGGTGYTGEIKKSVFSILNYILPQERNVLSMHCSANIGTEGDTSIFFGLSGTGKTTLSSDPNRKLIGDDEHGWSDNGIFNFEGGCYAKTIDLDADKEPQIFNAIKWGSLLENVTLFDGTSTPDYTNSSITENTRVSYPIEHIDNFQLNSIGGNPKNIFFLTADAFGVLPPISKLTKEQAMYHFMSGYTAKVAGTEMGITEPTTTFSACFGKAFLPLHPAKYADLLGNKLEGVNVWLVNTGWTGGSYGVGSRMKLPHTRSMITAAINGEFDNVEFDTLPIFNLKFPKNCPNVPTEILNPRSTWSNENEWDKVANNLAQQFIKNFQQFESGTSDEVKDAGPKLETTV
jgi:phosphoenolpyruvate carboxykinase (ATP)